MFRFVLLISREQCISKISGVCILIWVYDFDLCLEQCIMIYVSVYDLYCVYILIWV